MAGRQKLNYVGQMRVANGGPQNVELFIDERANLTDEERAAGIKFVNPRYEPGNVLRYGATGDGVTDDGTAVSDWLTVGMQGVPLTFNDGTALCTTWTQKSITGDIHVSGNGIIKGLTGVDFIKPEGGAFISDGIEYDTWRSLVENVVTDSGTTPTLEFRNCVIRNCSANGISHERPINRFVLDNVRMYGMSNYAVRIGRNVYAEQDNWKNFVIDNIYIEDCTAASSTDAAGLLLYGKNATLSNVHIGTITSDSGVCWGIYTKVRYVRASNILIEDISTTTGTDLAAYNIKGSIKGQTVSPQGYTYHLSNVTVLNSDGIGVKLQQQDVLATNILVEEFGTDGITIDEVNSPNVMVNGFKVLTAIGTSKVGVRLSNNVGNIKVLNGFIDGPDDGVRMGATVGGGIGYEIRGLNIDNAARGIYLNTNFAMDQVKFRDIYTGSGCTEGLRTGGTGAVTNLEVVDCDFTDAATTVIAGGTLTTPKFRKVRGYVTDNAGASSIATGATISHGLSSTPDVITVTGGAAGMTDLVVTSPTSSVFTVAFGGGGTNTVYWRASMDEAT